MSLDLGSFQARPYNPGNGQKPSAMPIRLCTPIDPQIGPKSLSVTIPWAEYGASFSNRTVVINVDLRSVSTAGNGAPLDAIRFLTIDNSFNDVTVYARFNDTGQVVQCPPNSIIGAQVQSANQSITVFGTEFFDGRTPQTTYLFSNTPQEPYFIADAGRYSVNGAITAEADSQAGGTSYTFNGLDVGFEASNRWVFCVALGRRGAGPQSTLNSISINGVSCLVPGTAANQTTNPGWAMGIGATLLETGITANFNVTFAQNNGECAVIVGSMYNVESGTLSSDSDVSQTASRFFGNSQVSPYAVPGAFALYAFTDNVAAFSNVFGDPQQVAVLIGNGSAYNFGVSINQNITKAGPASYAGNVDIMTSAVFV